MTYNRTVEADVVLRYTGLVQRGGGGLTDRFAKIGVICIDSGCIGLIKNGKGGEILPRKASLVLGALADIRSKQGPCPGLWNTNFEPNGHGEEAIELSEDHLLSRFSGDGLKQKLARFSRVEVIEESVHAGFAETGQFLAKVDKLAHSRVGIVVCTLSWCLSAQYVGDERCVTNFLVSHEFDKKAILRS